MKVLACALILLQLANFGAGQCAEGWSDQSGQCMQCSRTIAGGTDTTFIGAQDICKKSSGNLATVIDSVQESFASSCRTSSSSPWIGYTGEPIPAFVDGTTFVNYGGFTPAAPTATFGCYRLASIGSWTEIAASPGCGTSLPFACSRPYDSCYDLEVSGMMSVDYAHTDTSTRVDGARWVGTTATYSCSTGYNVNGGTTTRTCLDNGSWTDSEPECVVAAVCSALTVPSDSTISYSTTASGSSYTTGTVATQVCNSGYDKKSGTDTGTCQSSGAWTESAIVCEKNNNDELAIGLGVGLGVPLALALGALLFMMCRRAPALPRPAPAPRPAAYPRPAFRHPYPRKMGPRPFF